jgi:hypothetical protein
MYLRQAAAAAEMSKAAEDSMTANKLKIIMQQVS